MKTFIKICVKCVYHTLTVSLPCSSFSPFLLIDFPSDVSSNREMSLSALYFVFCFVNDDHVIMSATYSNTGLKLV